MKIVTGFVKKGLFLVQGSSSENLSDSYFFTYLLRWVLFCLSV